MISTCVGAGTRFVSNTSPEVFSAPRILALVHHQRPDILLLQFRLDPFFGVPFIIWIPEWRVQHAAAHGFCYGFCQRILLLIPQTQNAGRGLGRGFRPPLHLAELCTALCLPLTLGS